LWAAAAGVQAQTLPDAIGELPIVDFNATVLPARAGNQGHLRKKE
jgi:hypothetical protein